MNYKTAWVVSIVGFVVIFIGIFLAWRAKLSIGIVGTTSGVITEALGYFFFKRVDLANGRMDTYHRELLEFYWLESLLDVCQQLPAERRISGIERIIQAASDRWLGFAHSAKTVTRASAKAKKRVSPGHQGQI